MNETRLTFGKRLDWTASALVLYSCQLYLPFLYLQTELSFFVRLQAHNPYPNFYSGSVLSSFYDPTLPPTKSFCLPRLKSGSDQKQKFQLQSNLKGPGDLKLSD